MLIKQIAFGFLIVQFFSILTTFVIPATCSTSPGLDKRDQLKQR